MDAVEPGATGSEPRDFEETVLGRPGHEPGDAGTPEWTENINRQAAEMAAAIDFSKLRAATGSEPRTEAGRRLRDLSIAARYEAALRERIEALPFRAIAGSSLDERGINGALSCDWDEYLDLIDRDSVLALLAAAPLAEQRDGLDRWVHALHETLPCDDHDEIADGGEPLCEYLAVALRDRITDPTYLAATPSRPAEERAET